MHPESDNVVTMPSEERSLGTLLSNLAREITDLVRKEGELARAEASEKINQVQTALGSIAIGAAVLFAGLLVLLDAVVYGVSELLPPDLAPWLSAVIVGAVVIIIGYSMLKGGRNKLQANSLAPRRTAESLRKDQELVKEQVR